MIWIKLPSEYRERIRLDSRFRHDPFHYPVHAAGLYCVGDPEEIVAWSGEYGSMPLCHDSYDY